MNIEKWIIAHFSPTGGTKKVADAIAAGLDAPVVEMDLTKENVRVPLGDHDALIAVLPCAADFSGAAGRIKRQRSEGGCCCGLWQPGV